jgi:hypothetical protein
MPSAVMTDDSTAGLRAGAAAKLEGLLSDCGATNRKRAVLFQAILLAARITFGSI